MKGIISRILGQQAWIEVESSEKNAVLDLRKIKGNLRNELREGASIEFAAKEKHNGWEITTVEKVHPSVITAVTSPSGAATRNQSNRSNQHPVNNRNTYQRNQEQNEYRFFNPYNFVRYLEPVISSGKVSAKVKLMDKCPPPGHDRFVGLNGRITCRLKASTPLFVSDSHDIVPDEKNQEHKSYRFFQYDGKPAIPASSLRGMIRSVFEAASNSCFSSLDNRKLNYRCLPQEAIRMVPGRVSRQNGQFQLNLLNGTTPINSNGAPAGLQYAAWVPQWRRNEQAVLNVAVKEPWKNGRIKLWAILQADSHERPAFRYWRVISLGENEPSEALRENQIKARGWLYSTNHNINRKHDERFFFAQAQLSPTNLPTSVVDYYEAILSDYNSRKDQIKRASQGYPLSVFIEHNKTRLEDGDLVYAFLRPGRDGYEIERIVPVLVPRVLHPNSIGELLNQQLRRCHEYNALCPACRVFGWVQQGGENEGEKQVAYRGRVDFTHASMEKGETYPGDEDITLAILGTPKPTTSRFYLLKNNGGILNQVANVNCRYDKNINRLRGRKFYLHHPTLSEQEYRRETRDIQNRSVRGMVKPGAEFEFSIEYRNLAKVELGALLWSLELDPTCYHRIGYGKPLGFGSVQVNIKHMELLDISVRYVSTEKAAGWLAIKGDKLAQYKDGIVSEFTSAMQERYGRPFDSLNNIHDLKAIMGNSASELPIHYPRISPQPQAEGKNYEWFVRNNKERLQEVQQNRFETHHALPIPGQAGNNGTLPINV